MQYSNTHYGIFSANFTFDDLHPDWRCTYSSTSCNIPGHTKIMHSAMVDRCPELISLHAGHDEITLLFIYQSSCY